jgi:FHS family L-fucose permease-like MFS transporter
MNNSQKTPLLPMLIIGSMYVILGFSVGINAYFIPFVQEAFAVSTTASYLIMTATFSAYVLFGVPSGNVLKAVGYKKGISIAFLTIAVGFALIGYAADIVSFSLFLFALFIIGTGQTLLTGAINSYVTILGPAESAASRISTMGIADKLALAGASLILGIFLDLANVQLGDAIVPFYIIATMLTAIGILSLYSPLPELKAPGEDESEDEVNEVSVYANSKTSILEIPHVLLGVVAIFFDVGVEIIALGSINDYAKVLNLSSPENYVWLTTFGMVAGYLLGVFFIPKLVSQRMALVLCAVSGMLITISITMVPPAVSIYLVAALGLSNSLLWPAIFPLALADLGKFTKTGSSILVMGIIGGAVLPLIFGYAADLYTHQVAYLVCLPSYFYILYFALKGSRIRTGAAVENIFPETGIEV